MYGKFLGSATDGAKTNRDIREGAALSNTVRVLLWHYLEFWSTEHEYGYFLGVHRMICAMFLDFHQCDAGRNHDAERDNGLCDDIRTAPAPRHHKGIMGD